jgi:ATP-binding cassette subfamily B protein
VLKRPDVLILGEATATLDGPAQANIMANLFKAFEGRTLIWALHRASLAKAFDQIVVLKGGRVVQHGTYAELTAAPGVFADLVAAE